MNDSTNSPSKHLNISTFVTNQNGSKSINQVTPNWNCLKQPSLQITKADTAVFGTERSWWNRNNGNNEGSWSHGWNIKQQIFAIDRKYMKPLVVMGREFFFCDMGFSPLHKHIARVNSVSDQHIDYSKPGRTEKYWLKHLIIDCNCLWLSLVTYSVYLTACHRHAATAKPVARCLLQHCRHVVLLATHQFWHNQGQQHIGSGSRLENATNQKNNGVGGSISSLEERRKSEWMTCLFGTAGWYLCSGQG